MIEIKNKRMLLFPEDRIIGAQGDVNTAERKFVLDRVQDGFDLSSFVAWVKILPANGEEAYDQRIKKEIVGDRIVLTWLLSGINLKYEGELSVQIVLASPDYFYPEDLESLSDDDLILPSKVPGVSAPVWQTYRETFVVDASIDETVAYDYVTKNILLSAIARTIQNVEKTEEFYEECESTRTAVAMMYGSVSENIEYAETLRSATEAAALNAQDSKAIVEQSAKKAEEQAAQAEKYKLDAMDFAETANAYANDCTNVLNECAEMLDDAKNEIQSAGLYTNHRLIFSKTLTEEDTGYSAFEIDTDMDGKPLDLREFCFFLHIPAMPDAQNGYLRLDIKCDDSGFTRISQFAGISSSADTYLRVEAENKGRWTTKCSKSNGWFQNAEAVTVYGTLCSASRTSDGKSVKAVKLLQHSSVKANFPAGTLVELWGVNSHTTKEGANE